LVIATVLAIAVSAEVKYYNAVGPNITDYIEVTSTSAYFEYFKDTTYRSMNSMKVSLLNSLVLSSTEDEIIEVAQCYAGYCYLAVINATSIDAQEITVSEYRISDASALTTELNVDSAVPSTVLAAQGKLKASMKQVGVT